MTETTGTTASERVMATDSWVPMRFAADQLGIQVRELRRLIEERREIEALDISISSAKVKHYRIKTSVLRKYMATRTTVEVEAEEKAPPPPPYLSLTVSEIVERSMPIPDTVCGVYFLVQGNEVVYVGQSTNIPSRISNHMQEKRGLFNSFCWVAVPKELLNEVEIHHIATLRPRLNKSLVPR